MKTQETHPCFDKNASGKYMRLHLPVAPRCNIQCGYCDRRYDCVNESRPGVTSAVLSPHQALYYFREIRKNSPALSVVGIAGPGDSLATPERTLQTLQLLHTEAPDMSLCLSTNGLQLPEYVDDLKAVGLRHLTVTLNTVDPEIGSRIYSWVRYKRHRYLNYKAAELLLSRQLEGIAKACAAGFRVKINTLILPGINTDHIPEVSRVMKDLGVSLQNCLPFIPVAGTPLEDVPPPDREMIHRVREEASAYVPQMTHCGRCRSDAFGLIGSPGNDHIPLLTSVSHMPLNPFEDRPCIAVASEEGILINKHLGQAEELYIYSVNDGKVNFMERRRTPRPGGGDKRWEDLSNLLSDCHTLLVSGVGPGPFTILQEAGIKIHSLECLIEEALSCLADGQSLDHLNKRVSGVCSGCAAGQSGCS